LSLLIAKVEHFIREVSIMLSQPLSRPLVLCAALALAVLLPAPARSAEPSPDPKASAPRSRTFLFTYSAAVTGLPPGKLARIWLPVPTAGADQDVRIVSKELPAAAEKDQFTREPRFGNEMLYVEARAGADGTVPVKLTYQVTRREVRASLDKEVAESPMVSEFLKPDRKVPIDGKPLELIKDKKLPTDQVASARMLYDVVNSHMRYSKEGAGWGQGDAVWACDSGYGNCSDFHSLFISLARSQKIPAKFEIGFPLPDQRGAGEVPGYHCWAKFRPAGKGWIPVDISEANKNPKMRDYYFGNLTENRVTFTTGRDIDLEPKQDGSALNFFVYPYVEVEGKPHSKVERKFSYKDLKE
jgi:transglutaminase-like putative cysteine protease